MRIGNKEIDKNATEDDIFNSLKTLPRVFSKTLSPHDTLGPVLWNYLRNPSSPNIERDVANALAQQDPSQAIQQLRHMFVTKANLFSSDTAEREYFLYLCNSNIADAIEVKLSAQRLQPAIYNELTNELNYCRIHAAFHAETSRNFDACENLCSSVNGFMESCIGGNSDQYPPVMRELIKAEIAKNKATITGDKNFSYEALNRYSNAYQAMQGGTDYTAYRIEQHEVGYSSYKKIGTDNIQQCVVVIVRDPRTNSSALVHIDKFTDPACLKEIVQKIRGSTNNSLNIQIVGARDLYTKEQGNTETISRLNLTKIMDVLKTINGIDIKTIDSPTLDSNKSTPSAITFDPQTGAITHAVPGNPNGPNEIIRRPKLNLVMPSDKLFEDVNFDIPASNSTIKQAEEAMLFSFDDTNPSQPETWNSQIVLNPLVKLREKYLEDNPNLVKQEMNKRMDEWIDNLYYNPDFRRVLKLACKQKINEQIDNISINFAKFSYKDLLEEQNIALTNAYQDHNTYINFLDNIGYIDVIYEQYKQKNLNVHILDDDGKEIFKREFAKHFDDTAYWKYSLEQYTHAILQNTESTRKTVHEIKHANIDSPLHRRVIKHRHTNQR